MNITFANIRACLRHSGCTRSDRCNCGHPEAVAAFDRLVAEIEQRDRAGSTPVTYAGVASGRHGFKSGRLLFTFEWDGELRSGLQTSDEWTDGGTMTPRDLVNDFDLDAVMIARTVGASDTYRIAVAQDAIKRVMSERYPAAEPSVGDSSATNGYVAFVVMRRSNGKYDASAEARGERLVEASDSLAKLVGAAR